MCMLTWNLRCVFLYKSERTLDGWYVDLTVKATKHTTSAAARMKVSNPVWRVSLMILLMIASPETFLDLWPVLLRDYTKHNQMMNFERNRDGLLTKLAYRATVIVTSAKTEATNHTAAGFVVSPFLAYVLMVVITTAVQIAHPRTRRVCRPSKAESSTWTLTKWKERKRSNDDADPLLPCYHHDSPGRKYLYWGRDGYLSDAQYVGYCTIGSRSSSRWL